MTFQPSRPSAVARRKKAERRQFIKDIFTVMVALILVWALVWLAYFATI